MTDKKPTRRSKMRDFQNYTTIAIAFLASGIVFASQESTRILGLVFFILALTYFIIGQDQSKKPPKE